MPQLRPHYYSLALSALTDIFSRLITLDMQERIIMFQLTAGLLVQFTIHEIYPGRCNLYNGTLVTYDIRQCQHMGETGAAPGF